MTVARFALSLAALLLLSLSARAEPPANEPISPSLPMSLSGELESACVLAPGLVR
jgi:hypothetical protein